MGQNNPPPSDNAQAIVRLARSIARPFCLCADIRAIRPRPARQRHLLGKQLRRHQQIPWDTLRTTSVCSSFTLHPLLAHSRYPGLGTSASVRRSLATPTLGPTMRYSSASRARNRSRRSTFLPALRPSPRSLSRRMRVHRTVHGERTVSAIPLPCSSQESNLIVLI